MKALPKRKGNSRCHQVDVHVNAHASMKALPKRKGNQRASVLEADPPRRCLNESPSQKEGKFAGFCCVGSGEVKASMKALPKRKGNLGVRVAQVFLVGASMKALPKRKGNSQQQTAL